MGTVSFPGVKSGRGVTLTPYPLLIPRPRKSRAIPLLPYGQYGLYRASVPYKGVFYLYVYIMLKSEGIDRGKKPNVVSNNRPSLP